MAAGGASRLKERIVSDPEILVGKPVIKGTRISVELVLGFLAEKPDLGELCAAYPHLTLADVQACLAYARSLVAQSFARRKRTRKVRAEPKASPRSSG